MPQKAECNTGCRGYKTALEHCINDCPCKSDVDVVNGCNQQYSCGHACKMRDLGLDERKCISTCSQSKKKVTCSPRVKGHTFSLCGDCNRKHCSEKKPTKAECNKGCRQYRGKSKLRVMNNIKGICQIIDQPIIQMLIHRIRLLFEVLHLL